MAFQNSNTEVSFVLARLTELINWQSKQTARFSVECKDGKASVNFYCDLGLPGDKHVKSGSKKKAPSKTRRDNAWAAEHQATQQQQ